MPGTEHQSAHQPLQLDGLTIDLDDYCIYYADGTTTLLSGLEQLLLRTLIDAGGQAVTMEQLGMRVWGWECGYSASAIWTCVSDLRRKLRDNPNRPRYIQTVHRIGYRVRSRLLPEPIGQSHNGREATYGPGPTSEPGLDHSAPEPIPAPRRKERANGRRKR